MTNTSILITFSKIEQWKMRRTTIWLKEVEVAGQFTFLPPPFNLLEFIIGWPYTKFRTPASGIDEKKLKE